MRREGQLHQGPELRRVRDRRLDHQHEARRHDRPDLAYANVLRQLQLMHAKGLLKRDERQRAHVYAAVHAQASLQTRLLDDFIRKAFGGSGKALVMAALRGDRVSEDERAEIQRFLEETRDE